MTFGGVAFRNFTALDQVLILNPAPPPSSSEGYIVLYQQQTNDEDAPLSPLYVCVGTGATADIIAMSATDPMNMVRGRLTVQTDKSPYQYRGMFHALSTVLCEEGFCALYKGWLPSIIEV